MDKTNSRYRSVCICLLLIVVSVIAFEHVRENDFLRYDDNRYIVTNQHVHEGLTVASFKWAFSKPHFYMWHPVTTLSYLVEYELFGLDPFWYHLTNLMIHIANSVLLFWVLKGMTGRVWASAFAAAVFAVHPLQVESVAWVAERKNVLSGFFWILTVGAYARYTRRPKVGRYVVVLLIFCFGLMSKPTVIALPFVLLLLDYWPLCRPGLRRLIVEKIPLFVLSGVLSVITFIAQKGGATLTLGEHLGVLIRLSNALVSYVKYIGKIFCPNDLAVLYPHAGRMLPGWQWTGALILLVAISVLVLRLRRQRRYLIVGWLWYLGTLVPVIGLIQSGAQAMADRYIYLPLVGIAVMVGWGTGDIVTRWRQVRIPAVILAGAVVVGMVFGTRMQVRYWESDLFLFEHCLEVTKDNYVMHDVYGSSLGEDGRLEESEHHLRKSLEIHPDYHKAHNNIGNVFYLQGRYNQAGEHFAKAVDLKPEYADAYFNLGLTYGRTGNYDLAIENYEQVLRLRPDNPRVHFHLGKAMMKVGRCDQAVNYFGEALGAGGNLADIYHNLGLAHHQCGRADLAIYNWDRTLELDPNSVGTLNNLAWVLVNVEDKSLRNVGRAISLSEWACSLTGYKYIPAMNTLAGALAAKGGFDEAVSVAERALELAESANQKVFAEEIRGRLKLYRASRVEEE